MMDRMSPVARPLTEMPRPQYVMSSEGHRIATYSWGDPSAPTVLCVHGFASSCRDNWVATGWVRDLTAAGFRVLGVDQRGHGLSDKPHDPHDYTMDALVGDLLVVLETHLLDSVLYAGYSLGGRVGWQLLVDAPDRVARGVLGGIPDGRPLARLDIEQARAFAETGAPITDRVTQNYVTLAERVPGNDLRVLVALADGMRLGDADPDPARPPQQPVLFATGSDDAIL
jgi:pimeloyl-ACP methyl ester carboxylesterase